MTLYESIKNASKKRRKVNEDAAGSMIGARNVADSGKEKDVQKAIITTLDTASSNDGLKAMSVIARAPGNAIYNNVAKGENGFQAKLGKENLAESIKRVHKIKK